MKKLMIVCSFALLGLQESYAQAFEPHVGVGVGVGLTGIVIDASATINPWLGARFGVDIMPVPTLKTEFDLGIEDKTNGTSISEMSKYIDDLNTKIDAYNADVAASLIPGPALEKVDRQPCLLVNFPMSWMSRENSLTRFCISWLTFIPLAKRAVSTLQQVPISVLQRLSRSITENQAS